MWPGLMRDVKNAWRFLTARKGWTTVVIVSLSLAIGANAVVFSIMDSVLLRPFPYENPDEIVLIWNGQDLTADQRLPVPDLETIRAQSQTLEAVGWYRTNSWSPDFEPLTPVAAIEDGVFEALGVNPELGRAFSAEDEGARRVILSFGFWQSHYAGDPGVLGETLNLNASPYEIVGVMPRGFFFPEPAVEFWTRIAVSDSERTNRNRPGYQAVGRLKAGTAIEVARAELRLISGQLNAEFDRSNPIDASLVRIEDVVLGDHTMVLWMLMGGIGCVLLAGCVNLANLLLMRGMARQMELGLRETLGANRVALIRQLVFESLLVSLVGGITALAFGYMGIRLVLGLGLMDIPRINNVSMNGLVIAFAVAVSLLTGLVSGLVPAFRTSRTDLTTLIKTGTQSSSPSGSRRTQDIMVVLQIAIALMLMVAAGLLVRSAVEVGHVDWGFDPQGSAVLTLQPPLTLPLRSNEGIRFAEEALDEIRRLEGVQTASAGVMVPLAATGAVSLGDPVIPEGGRVADAVTAHRVFVTRDYFEALGIQVAGREFEEGDRAGGQKVVILSRSLADSLFPGGDPVGQTIHFATPARDSAGEGVRVPPGVSVSIGPGGLGTYSFAGPDRFNMEVTGTTAHVVIGVADDVRMTDDLTAGMPASMLYLDYRQAEDIGLGSDILMARWTPQPGTFVIRSDSLSQGLIDQVRSILVSLNPDVSFYEVARMQDLVAEAGGGNRSGRLILVLGVSFAMISLLLASVGIYGVMSHAVSQRAYEIGIRMAVGAAPHNVLLMVLKQGLLVTTTGLALGLVAAVASSRILESQLFGISPTDPTTYVLVILCLLATATVACLLPARRAARVDPLVATRAD